MFESEIDPTTIPYHCNDFLGNDAKIYGHATDANGNTLLLIESTLVHYGKGHALEMCFFRPEGLANAYTAHTVDETLAESIFDDIPDFDGYTYQGAADEALSSRSTRRWVTRIKGKTYGIYQAYLNASNDFGSNFFKHDSGYGTRPLTAGSASLSLSGQAVGYARFEYQIASHLSATVVSTWVAACVQSANLVSNSNFTASDFTWA